MKTGRIALVLGLVLSFGLLALGQQDHGTPSGRYVVKVSGKYGYIDRTGSVVIEPKFDEAKSFADGLAAVKTGGWCGYIDTSGELVIRPQFYQCEDFSEGLALVIIGDYQKGKRGYIDKTGQMVINPRFEIFSRGFSDGLAAVSMDCKFNPDQDGNSVPSDCKYGYIDKAGQVVIEPKYIFALDFSEGLAGVGLGNKLGFIDKTGKVIIKGKFSLNGLSRFSEGLAAVSKGNKKFGYIDKTGEFVIESQFDFASPFSEGLAKVSVGKKYGYIDKTGKFVIDPQFDVIPDDSGFSDGMARVAVGCDLETGENCKWGYIDTTGKMVIIPRFSGAGLFKEGMAWVFSGGKNAYIDKSGNLVWGWTE